MVTTVMQRATADTMKSFKKIPQSWLKTFQLYQFPPTRLWESKGTIFVRVELTDGELKTDSIHVWTLEGEKLKIFEAF